MAAGQRPVPKDDGNGTGPQRIMDPPLTPAEEWQRLRVHGAVKVLESTGRVIRWRPVNVTRMLQAGDIPDHLSGYVAKRLWSGNLDDERDDKAKLIDWMDYHVLVATASLLHPRIVEDPQTDDEIHADDLLDAELVEIERMARDPVDEVKRFRRKQDSHVDAVPEGGQVGQAAE